MKHLTISFQDHYLCFRSASDLPSFRVPPGFHIMDDSDFEQCFSRLLAGDDVWVWCNESMRRVVAYCLSNYRYVKAAGGLVTAPTGKSLLIFREGHWDIPKGMVEPGETIAQAALREVREETGIQDVRLGSLITKTYHIYDKYGGWHMKQTSWYRMISSSESATLPQQVEGITQALWFSPEERNLRLATSFASLKLVNKCLIDTY